MIVGFAGRKRSGKSQISKFLKRERNFHIVTVADGLKHLSCRLLDCDMETLNRMKDDGTEFSLPVKGKVIEMILSELSVTEEVKDSLRNEYDGLVFTNVRQILQMVGTDFIRKVDPLWHVRKMVETIKNLGPDADVAIDDVRFPDERKAIENLGGEVYFIIRPTFFGISNHSSEIGLSFRDFDKEHIIINDGSVERLEKCFDDFLNGIVSISTLYDGIGDGINRDFGCKLTSVVKDVLEQNLARDAFMTNGIITYETNEYGKAYKFIEEAYDGEYSNKHDRFPNVNHKRFVIYSPFVVENMKALMTEGTDALDPHRNFPISYGGHTFWNSRSVAVVCFIFRCIGNALYVLAEVRGEGSADNHGKKCAACGYLDWNETAENGVAREIYEELGMCINKSRLKFFGIMTDPERDARQNVCIIYTYEAMPRETFNLNEACGGEENEVAGASYELVARLDGQSWKPNHEVLRHDEWAFNHDRYIYQYIEQLNNSNNICANCPAAIDEQQV